MKDKKEFNLNITITEIFMAKAGNDYSRCFHGAIRRETDADGNPVCYGKIKVGDGYVCAMAKDQNELGEWLDMLVLMVLDYDIHKNHGIITCIGDDLFFLN